MQKFRSTLFAPGNQPRKCEKALTSIADVVCLDLEDAVPRDQKGASRKAVAAMLEIPRSVPTYVRVNGMQTAHCFADLKEVVKPGLSGIILPRYESAGALATIDWVLGALEREAGLQAGCIDVIPVVETAIGMSRLSELQQPPARVRRLSFGAWDYTLDTGIFYAVDEFDIGHARSAVVMHSRAAGLEAPIDTSYPIIGDLEGLERSCRRAKNMGFQGKACIHPEQVEPANRVFSPSDEELQEAHAIVSGFEAAEATGAAAVKIAGKFVDYPIYEKARRLVEAHGKAPVSGEQT
jgi:citrate lyase subunit beta/citryl-CoA lyase